MGFIGVKFKLIYHQKELITVLVSCYTGIQEILWKIMVEYGRYHQNIAVMKWDFTTKSEEWGFDQWIIWKLKWNGMEKKILSYLLAIFDLWGYDKCFLSLLESHNVSYGIKIMEFYHQTLRTMWSSPKKKFQGGTDEPLDLGFSDNTKSCCTKIACLTVVPTRQLRIVGCRIPSKSMQINILRR